MRSDSRFAQETPAWRGNEIWKREAGPRSSHCIFHSKSQSIKDIHAPCDRGSSLKPSAISQLWREVRALNLVDAREGLEAAEHWLLSKEVEAAQPSYADLFAIRAMTLALDDDTLSASAAAEQALRHGTSEKFARLSRLVLRFCAWKAGAIPASGDDLTQHALEAAGSPESTPPNDVLADVLDLALAAAIEFGRLQIPTAERLARCALRRAGGAPATSVLPASILARILYEQGRIQEAEKLLVSRLPMIQSVGGLDCIGHSHSVCARIAAHRGDYASAIATLDAASALAEKRNWPRLLAWMLAERIRLCEPGDEKQAALWLRQLHNLAQRHQPPGRCARSDIACYWSRAQLHCFLRFGLGASPRTALAYLRHDAWLSQDLNSLGWIDLAEAQLLWVEGDQDKGIAYLAETLRATKATGLHQPLIDAGPLLPSMIDSFLQRGGIEQGLLAFTICLADSLRSPGTCVQECRRRAVRGRDCLTMRERDVLKLIGEGGTNKIIAEIQGITPETVKSHVKSIFAKLGVERRAQAVIKAQRLGILAT